MSEWRLKVRLKARLNVSIGQAQTEQGGAECWGANRMLRPACLLQPPLILSSKSSKVRNDPSLNIDSYFLMM